MISVHVLLQNAAKKFYLKILNGYAVFIPGIIFFFLGGGNFAKKFTIPSNGCQIVCSKSFFSARAANYKYMTVTFF